MSLTSSTSNDLDSVVRYALKLLHSPNSDSAEKIRTSLDEIIKQRHGSSKMLANTLNKKYLAEEANATGSGLGVRKLKSEHKQSNKQQTVPVVVAPVIPEPVVANALPASLSITPTSIMLSVSDLENTDEDTVEEDHLKELEDLMCVVCRRMDVSARNRLVECADCHSLYHQECHKPQISEADANDQENSWYCTICKSKIPISKSSSSTSSPAKSSSSSSSTYIKSSSKNHESSSSSSSSRHKSSSSSSKSSSKVSSNDGGGNGNSSDKEKDKPKSGSSTNIISADKRLQIMKKKAAKLQESKRKLK